MSRSNILSKEGLAQANKSLKIKNWNLQKLVEVTTISRATISKFFNRKPIDRSIFEDVCDVLGLNYEEVIEAKVEEQIQQDIDINQLVSLARENIREYVQYKCGTIRVLDMEQPLSIDEIYVRVNVFKRILGRVWLTEDMIKNKFYSEIDRFNSRFFEVREERVEGLKVAEDYSKLIILGKPGSGKTTFLKHLALQCMEKNFQLDLIPFFVSLKDYSDNKYKLDLLEYLIQEFIIHRVLVNKNTKNNSDGILGFLLNRNQKEIEHLVDRDSIEQLLKHGKLLILLDGLDEVKEVDTARVQQEIREFTERFHNNKIIITCRIAAREYCFNNFTEVEITEFDNQQIRNFAKRWYLARAKQNITGLDSKKIIREALEKTNRFNKELDSNEPIKELANKPLLLTLLCLVFEETGSFPKNRSYLYKEGLDILLKKWDARRNIERDQIYKNLFSQRKEDLLSEIAYDTFRQGKYFFQQEIAKRYINLYIRNLPNASADPQVLEMDSHAVLKSIEAQHGLLVERARGIYSFSHLTFQEYFTARKIVAKASDNQILQSLINEITTKSWREVFLLTVEMLDSADKLLLLMKQKVDNLIIEDEKLQQFLAWINEKSSSVNTPYKIPAIRAFYLSLVYNLTCHFSNICKLAIQVNLSSEDIRNLKENFNLIHDPAPDLVRDEIINFDLALDLEYKKNSSNANNFDHLLELLSNPDSLQQELQKLKQELNHDSDFDLFNTWWQENGKKWTGKLRQLIIKYRDTGHGWEFSDEQKNSLRKYYQANKLLLDCLYSDCCISPEVRHQIESTLLVPVARISD